MTDEDADTALSEAFIALAGLAGGSASAAEYEDALEALRGVDDGSDLAPQVDTARSVIGV